MSEAESGPLVYPSCVDEFVNLDIDQQAMSICRACTHGLAAAEIPVLVVAKHKRHGK